MEFFVHHIHPVGMGGPDVASNRIALCPTTHANVHEVLRLLVKEGMKTYRQVAVANSRIVSHYAYDLAVDGYERWLAANP